MLSFWRNARVLLQFKHTQSSVISIGHFYCGKKIISEMFISAEKWFCMESPFNTNTAFETVPFHLLNNPEKVICFLREIETLPLIFPAIILIVKYVLVE